ncbi:solute carrier organic anion transporter family member 3A1 [Nephila pilipes]|uniref:Solute carrier organic anion transporter family member 3A1 n=1 Tax=Nephila pilipes TaxID=299642 RepID=A0A8X6PFH9_NEPPI|nr:solute carrier organic anion transporter family member 3A1 [Nephila pilipes]
MDEEIDETGELKSHLPEKAKAESLTQIKPEDSAGTTECDVIPLHHNPESSSCVPKKIDISGFHDPVDARQLNSVFQYTSKIRAFIGLLDPEEESCAPASPLASEKGNDEPVDANDKEKNDDDVRENLEDLEENINKHCIEAVSLPLSEIEDVNVAEVNNIKNNFSGGNEQLEELVQNDDENYTISDSHPLSQIDNNNLGEGNNKKKLREIDGNLEEFEQNDDENSILKSDSYILSEVEKQSGDANDRKEDCDEIDDNLKDLEKNNNISDREFSEAYKEITNLNNHPEFNQNNLITSPDENIKLSPESKRDFIIPQLLLNENDGETKQIDSLPLFDVERAIPNLYESTENTVLDDSGIIVDEETPILKKINEQITADDLVEILPISDQGIGNLLELSENLGCEKDSKMSRDNPDDNIKTQLLENGHSTKNGQHLNDPETIMKDELNNISQSLGGDAVEQGVNLQELPEKIKEDRSLEADDLDIRKNNNQNENVTENLSNELNTTTEQQNSTVVQDEAKPAPRMEDIRRLSVEIVNKVLDNAGNQLRDMLNEKRNSKTSEILQDKHNLDKIEDSDCYVSIKQPKGKNNEIQLKDILAKTYDSNDFQKKIELEMNKYDPRYDLDPDIICGMGCFKPQWIQKYATARVYLVLYSIIGIFSGSYYTYLIGSMSTLEKRFAFKSKTSGSIMMLDEITPLFLGIIIGYFGGKTHRPRMVGFGMLLSSICCFVSALPYFIYGPGTHLILSNVKNSTTGIQLCDAEIREENCDSDDRPPTLAAILFLMCGSFLKGFGNLAYYAVGLAYMDDNAKKKNTPIYFAIAFALRLLGPMVGFFMSSFFLSFYENPFVDPGFEKEDPRWIGCWWLGFVVQGVLLLIFTIPISLFPRRLPGSRCIESKSEESGLVSNFAGLFVALKRLAVNPLYILLILNTIMAIFGAFGHYIMLPKYMENQFRLSSSDSSLLSGPPGIGAVMISTIVGGYMIWKLRPNAKMLSGGLVILETITAIGFFLLMIPRCTNIEMTNYGTNNEGLILESSCNLNCNCSTSAFTPVCGPDGKTLYFSPCHAGCSDSSNETFTNCSCVFDSSGLERDYVTEGFCVIEGCWSQALAYIITLPILEIIVSVLKVAYTMILLRSINPEDKSVALGTFETVICIFGFIPYPIVFGVLVDSACLVWEKSCGETGNCWFYDVPKFNYLLHGASALFSILSALSFLGIYFLSGRVGNLYDEDEEPEANDDVKQKELETKQSRQESNSATKL